MGRVSVEQKQKMAKQGYVQLADAARAVSKDRATLLRWIRAKKVKSMRVGADWYITKKSLVEYLGPDAAKALGLV